MRTLAQAVTEFWRRLLSLRRRPELEAGLDDEIRFHLDQQTTKNVRAGMTPEEARRRALIEFGAMQAAREGVRDELRAPVIEALGRDLRYAVRALRRAPAFTIAATLTLALGIGATTAMFSVLNGIVLRPLPYPNQDRLVELLHDFPRVGRVAACPAVYFGYRDYGRVFESVGLWDWDRSPVTVVGKGEPEAVASVEVTHEVLTMLGARPIAGRAFAAADDLPGSAPTAMVSYGYWQRRFGGGTAVGEVLVVDGIARRVIGVLPRSFNFFDYPADIFYPLQPVRATAIFPAGDGRGVALLKEGVTLDQANADVARIDTILDAEFPGGNAAEMKFAPNLTWLKDRVVGDLADTLWILMGTIALLLTMACANVANLVLVRTHARAPELAVRSALGAGWGAIARVVATESVLLAAAGGIGGLAIAYASLPFLLALAASDLPQIMTVRIDPTVLLVTAAASACAAMLCGLLPLAHFARPRHQIAETLHGDGRAATGGRESHRTRHLLVVCQVAVALILLIGAGLMARAFQSLRAVDPGFRDPDTVQTFQWTIPSTPGAEIDDAARGRMLRMQRDLADRLAAIPGVAAVGFSSSNDGLPLDDDGRTGLIAIEGQPETGDLSRSMELLLASPGFFETLGAPPLAGRAFDWNDVERANVVLVSENLARTAWGSVGSAVGKRVGITTGTSPEWFEVVGVVKDMPQYNLASLPPRTVIFPAFARNATASFVIRSTRAGTPGLIADVRKALQSVSAASAPSHVQTLGEMYRHSMARTSMLLLVLAITGIAALLLGLVGVYGIVSYAVEQRRREIGIRLALGAARGAVRLQFVQQALVLVAIGVGAGLAAAMGLTRVMTSQLFGISPLDPSTHLTVAAVLLVAAGLASFVSAHRAATLDPVEVLRG